MCSTANVPHPTVLAMSEMVAAEPVILAAIDSPTKAGPAANQNRFPALNSCTGHLKHYTPLRDWLAAVGNVG